MEAAWELLHVSDGQTLSSALNRHDPQPFWLLEHDPLWHSALLYQPENSVTLVRRNGACLLGLFSHFSGLDVALGEVSLATLPVRRNVLTGGIAPDVASAAELCGLLIQLSREIGPTGVIFLQGVRDDEPLRAVLDTSALRDVYRVMRHGRPYQRCRIALHGNFNAYIASLGKRTRKDIVRTMRDFNDGCGRAAELQVVTSPAALERGLPELIALSQKTYHGGVLGLGPASRNYVERQMRAAAERGLLRLDLLRVQGALAAFQIGYVYRNTLFSMFAGFDPAQSHWSPGVVHHLLAIDNLCSSRPDVTCFDFMYGDSIFKHRFSNLFHGESQFYLIPRTARGFATWLAVRGMDRISRATGAVLEKLGLRTATRNWLRRASTKTSEH